MSNKKILTNPNKKLKEIETSEGLVHKEEVEKSVPLLIIELVEYIPNSILRKTIFKKATGSITISSFDTDRVLTERISPFDTFIQIIEGSAEILISKKSVILSCGQSIVIPAHASHVVKANNRFKMLQTVIKSGYDI